MDSNQNFIVADSGGSGTSWLIVKEGKVEKRIDVESLHPKFLQTAKPSPLFEIEEEYKKNFQLYFYGAGCGNEQSKRFVEKHLKEIGFKRIEVFPDTLAACRAFLANNSGYVGIFGTGSIIVQYDGNKIIEKIGGLGSMIGDEGSGYCFGKLLLKHLLLEKEWTDETSQIFHSKEQIAAQLASPTAIHWVSSLAKLTSHIDFTSIHIKNIKSFIEEYKNQLSGISEVSIIGSYAYFNQKIFCEEFLKVGVKIVNIEKDPLEKLVAFHRNFKKKELEF